MELHPGTRLGPYEILSPLGAGGMGVVYRARDPRLGREVAIKVLPAAHSFDPDRLARFRQEARAASKLNHPNILVIHDIGVHEGTPYVVSELLEGETLRERMDSAPVPVRQAEEYALQIAQGLAAAHAKGIVHRDIKPENLFVTQDGRVKILDFGLAKLAAHDDGSTVTAGRMVPGMTEPGSVLGTVGYMSPEQVRGFSADHRSDVFSLGTVLYELLMGERAFRRGSAVETMNAILHEAPPGLATASHKLSPVHERIMRRCLAKDPSERFQSTGELVVEIQALLAASPRSALPSAWRHTRTFRLTVVAGSASVAAAAIWLIWFARLPERNGSSAEQASRTSLTQAPSDPLSQQIDLASVAVLPFVNMSEDTSAEYFSDGVSEELINALAKTPGLRVTGRTSSFAFKGKNADLRVIGQELGVGTILEGSVRMAGGRVRITAQLVSALDGFHLWSETYDRTLEDIFSVQEDVARSVTSALKLKLLGEEVPRATSRDMEAYENYLQGLSFMQRAGKNDLEKAVVYYVKAVAVDSTFAPAWAGLSSTYASQAGLGFEPRPDAVERARAAAKRALVLDANLAEAHAVMGRIQWDFDWDWTGAEAEFRRALMLEPSNINARHGLARIAVCQGRLEEALVLMRRAVEIDPLAASLRSDVAWWAWFAGRLDEAEAAAKKVLELTPNYSIAQSVLGRIYLSQGRDEAALAEIEKDPLDWSRWNGLAIVYHAMGREADSDRALEQLMEAYGNDAALQAAEVCAFRGQTDRAFDWLERAYTHRDPGLVEIKVNPFLKSLERDPRYARLLERMHLPL